jgi:hypothetical protein
VSDYLDSLDRLAGLFQKGVLTKEEFESEKARLLAGAQVQAGTVRWASRTTLLNRKAVLASLISFTLIGGAALGLLVWRDLPDSSPANAIGETDTISAQRTRLEGRVGFSDLSKCAPDAGFAQLLGRLREAAGLAEESLIWLTNSPNPILISTARASNDAGTTQIAAVPLATSWLGLHVERVDALSWNQGLATAIHLSDRSARVSEVLAENGLKGLKSGSTFQGNGAFFAIESKSDDGTGFTCGMANGSPPSDEGSDQREASGS